MKYSIIFAAAAVASEVYPTTIKDYDHKDCTVTAADQSVLVYHTAYTITHTESSKYGGYAQPTGAYPAAPSGCWYEKYEKQEYAPYNKLGPHAIPGWNGVDDCEEAKTEQPVEVREYKNGKWNTYTQTHTYKAPTPAVTTYSKAGTYTIPSGDCTVESSSYFATETSKVYAAGETCTYGGKYVDALQTGYMTVPYAEYDSHGKPQMMTKTVYASSTGKVEVCKPTTTSYPQATTVHWASASWYNPGVYHYPEQTVKAETDGHVVTCTYDQVKDYQYVTKTEYPAYPTATPVKPEDSKYYPSYPSKPEEATSTPCDEETYPTATPVSPGQKYPSYPVNGTYPQGYATGYKPYPVDAAASTPCDEEEQAKETGYVAKPVDSSKYPSKPVEGDNKYPSKPVDSEHKPVYSAYPSKPVSDEEDCEEGPEGETKKPYPSAYPQMPSSDEHKPYPATPSSDDKTKYPAAPSSDDKTKYPAGPSSDSKTPYPAKPVSDDKTKYPAGPTSDSKTPYPAKPVSDEDCDDDKTVNDKTNGYKVHPRAFAL